MKVLVAATCVVVIAAIGYWGWQQYRASTEASELAQLSEERARCIEAAKRFVADNQDHKDADACVASGLLRPGEIQTITNGGTIY